MCTGLFYFHQGKMNLKYHRLTMTSTLPWIWILNKVLKYYKELTMWKSSNIKWLRICSHSEQFYLLPIYSIPFFLLGIYMKYWACIINNWHNSYSSTLPLVILMLFLSHRNKNNNFKLLRHVNIFKLIKDLVIKHHKKLEFDILNKQVKVI